MFETVRENRTNTSLTTRNGRQSFLKSRIQPKLTINQPNDIYEQEADAMADRVMRIPGASANLFFKPSVFSIQRNCAHCEEEKEMQLKENGDDKAAASTQIEDYVNSLSGGRTLSEKEQRFFEPRIGYDFSNVKIHTGADAAKSAQSINALAYATGNNIIFNEGQYSPHTDKGKKLLGHELTHVVQQAGNSSSDVIRRFQIEGPWNINDPVHENITLSALVAAGIVPFDTKFDAGEVWEYMRGAIWNDDPEGLLFDNNEKENQNWSSGIEWKGHFDEGGKKAKAGKTIGPGDTLTARSHYGDLQFIHGMASKDGEKASGTKEKIMMWAEFTYKVSIDEIGENTTLDSVPVSGIPALFKGTSQEKSTVRSLFHVHKTGSTQKRAIGSLLHVIQDSYAEGHTQRADLGNNKRGQVESFHSYTHQDEEKHGKKDAFPPEKKGETMIDRISRLPGGYDAIVNCAVILLLFKQKSNWDVAKGFLDNVVFKLADPDNLSGPGAAFEKKTK